MDRIHGFFNDFKKYIFVCNSGQRVYVLSISPLNFYSLIFILKFYLISSIQWWNW